MKNSKRVVVLGVVAALIAAGVLVLTRARQSQEAQEAQQSGSREPLSWATLDIAAFAEAELKIERLRKQANVDWPAIRGEVEKTLPLVRFMDEQLGVTYQAEMAAALAKCERGERPKVNQQVIAKGLQHVAVLGIDHAMKLLASGDTTDGRKDLERVAALAKGIKPTFVRRDKDYFGGQPTLSAQLDQVVASLPGSGDDPSRLAKTHDALIDAITRTYALSVLYEIEQVEKLRIVDLAGCEVKRAEAVIFYRIIANRISKQDAQAHGAIVAMLKATPDQMSASLLKSQLQTGLPGMELQ